MNEDGPIEKINKTINDNPDSLEIGTPAKGGAIKIYGDYMKPDEFAIKIDNAIEIRKYTQDKIGKGDTNVKR